MANNSKCVMYTIPSCRRGKEGGRNVEQKGSAQLKEGEVRL